MGEDTHDAAGYDDFSVGADRMHVIGERSAMTKQPASDRRGGWVAVGATGGPLFRERPQAGVQDFDVDFSTRGSGARFGEANLRLKQVVLEAAEFIWDGGRASASCRARRGVGL